MTLATSHQRGSSADSARSRRSTSQDVRCDPSSIGVLIDAHFGMTDSVRNPDRGFLNRWVGRMQQKTRGPDIRGNAVAADTLVDAFIQNGIKQYEFFVFPEALARVSGRVDSANQGSGTRKVVLNSVFDLFKGVDKYGIRAWFNPMPHCMTHGGLEISHRVRSHFGSRIYPITTLFHGLSMGVYEVYLKLIMQPTFPCDSIVCSSRASCDSARKIFQHLVAHCSEELGTRAQYNGRFDIIPLCVDTSELKPRDKRQSRNELRLPNKSFILLYLGKISPMKADLYPLLQAFQSLVNSNRDRELLWVIAGTDDQGYADLILRRAREFGFRERIRLFLNISEEKKSQLLSAADVFVSPADSLDESFGLTPVEAMACGLPQVVPAWSGYRETVSHGETGFLVPTYWSDCCDDLTDTNILSNSVFNKFSIGQSVAVDMTETTRCVQALIDNEEMRCEMAKRSRRRALALYSFEAVVKQYEQLWEELGCIALDVRADQGFVNYDRLRYYEIFGNYASVALTNETTVKLTELGNGLAAKKTALPNSLPRLAFRFLDQIIIQEIVAKLTDLQQNGTSEIDNTRGVTIGELIRLLAPENGLNADYLRRHVMWLIKYSYVRPTNARPFA